MSFKSCATVCAGAVIGLAITSFASVAPAADLMVKAKPPAEPPFWIVNDNSWSYAYAFNATDPFVGKTDKQILSFTHFDIWRYGTNFVNIDGLKSDLRDPASPCGFGSAFLQNAGCEGATEIYAFFRSTLGWKQLWGFQGYGWLSNISFKVGGDYNTENNAASPAKRDVVAGLQFDFDLPFGIHFAVSPLAYWEKNHNGFVTNPTSGVRYFETTYRVESLLSVPLGPKGTPWSFTSLFAIQGPKGTGLPQPNVPPTFETKTEVFTQQKISFDVGSVTFNKPNMVFVWVAYTYWYNKFGIDHTLDPTGGSIESSTLIGTTWAF
jgi:hypothetical protein